MKLASYLPVAAFQKGISSIEATASTPHYEQLTIRHERSLAGDTGRVSNANKANAGGIVLEQTVGDIAAIEPPAAIRVATNKADRDKAKQINARVIGTHTTDGYFGDQRA